MPNNPDFDSLPNGPGAAAILAAGIGSITLGVLAFAGDTFAAVGQALSFWPPTGTLSGVTIVAIAVWLAVWFALSRRWHRRDINLVPINVASFAMLFIALLLTFPPFMDLLQGK